MKKALWILGGLLAVDIALVVGASLRATAYEDALAAQIYGLLIGLPALGAFIAILVIHLRAQQT